MDLVSSLFEIQTQKFENPILKFLAMLCFSLLYTAGGNADHWRKNIAPLAAAGHRVFAVDLLGS